jgi:hypothetical protein
VEHVIAHLGTPRVAVEDAVLASAVRLTPAPATDSGREQRAFAELASSPDEEDREQQRAAANFQAALRASPTFPGYL